MTVYWEGDVKLPMSKIKNNMSADEIYRLIAATIYKLNERIGLLEAENAQLRRDMETLLQHTRKPTGGL